MTHDNNDERMALRREVHALNDGIGEIARRIAAIDKEAASAVNDARRHLFDAWTYLCIPPEDDDDH
ncbi:hypothetical protein [Novosphingobium pentaromativorans]|uniref:Uncharacterized protein n=1 Tax=Novosphingobium pentaromativorans US6-1 TaxID=1088721 RepID=G6ED88_9SPHN|nr:hypothetical protein [Novosphingobium pentaromativorans]AIT79820.1 hypothetical protein JI59_08550 [Novosphingobium pentaromativorans US6-1]EHJ60687.1 hypothetical protein NSU_2309 [Novosphingobium pentaromativorans US6-1]